MSAIDREAAHFFHTYKRLPLEIDRGEGTYLIAKDGNRYLDMFAGLAVNGLGYGHPRLLETIQAQAGKYLHLSNYFLQEPQLQLAERLTHYSGFKRVFFTNSGTEAIEGAIKIARKWGSTRGKSELIGFSNGFHGRTMGALSLMDRPKYRSGFEPFLSHCRVIDANSIHALKESVGSSTAAVVLEFIQGEGGIRPVSPAMANALRELKKEFGFLLIADEIQSGIGRTGKFFGFQHFNIQPDIAVIAKPIGGGLPLGAILGGDAVVDVLQSGMHGTTFGGNPVACAAGLVVLDEVMERGLMKNAETMGRLLVEGLNALHHEFPHLMREIRGFGLMVGAEMTRECDGVVQAMRERFILINGTDQTVLRFLPPLIVGKEEIGKTISTLRNVLKSL